VQARSSTGLLRSSQKKEHLEKRVNSKLYRWLRVKVNDELVGFLKAHALPASDAVVVEAGCGLAEGAVALADVPKVKLSVALDLSRPLLRAVRDRHPKVCLVQGDLFRLPFKPGSCDLVWNNSTIEHVHETRRAIYEMVHVTKPGGRIFIGVPYRNGPFFFQGLVPWTDLGRWIGKLFDQSTLAVEVEGTGVEMERFTTYFFRAFVGCLARKTHPPAG